MSRVQEINEKFKNELVYFGNEYCSIKFRTYMSGRLYATLHDAVKPEIQVCRITLDIDAVPVIDDMIIVKDYRENEGIYKALLESCIIKECERKIAVGFDFGLICFLNL